MSIGRILKLVLVLSLVLGCAARQAPLPLGYIPQARAVNEADLQFGHDVFAQISERYQIDRDDARINRVRDIVDRLTKAVDATQDPWHVYVLVDDNFTNAAATRGNYVFVWTGMFKFVQSDEELATILSHEIGHVLAGHTAASPDEEVNGMIASVSGEIVGQIVSAQGGIAGAFGDLAGALVEEGLKAFIVNPQSQSKELEADSLGLMIMAKAGYDPESAIEFWSRLEHVPEFDQGLGGQFLSSHPSTKERTQHLLKALPPAVEAYDEYKNFSLPIKTTNRDKTIKSKKGVTRWRVSSEYADVHQSPSKKSAIIASLPEDLRVDGAVAKSGWVKITKPYQGYIAASDLAR